MAKSKHPGAAAYKAWLQALEEMRAALTANPLVADPFMASAQVFEDIGRVMFSNHTAPKKPRKRAKAKRASAKKKTTVRRARKS
jgi:hypothetical protein